MYLTTDSPKTTLRPWLIVYADFCGVSIPTTVNFKPPRWFQLACKISANLTIRSCKVRISQFPYTTVWVGTYLFNTPACTYTWISMHPRDTFLPPKKVKWKTTYRNKSAGKEVSEMLANEPSRLSREKIQFDYFLLLHYRETTTQASSSKCTSHSPIFKYLSSEGRK